MPPKRKKKSRTRGVKIVKRNNTKGMHLMKSGGTHKVRNSKTKHFCGACPKIFGTRLALRKHEAAQHPQQPPSIVIKKAAYDCKECSKKFMFKNSYVEHLRVEHSSTPGSVACEQCHVRCPDDETLNKHISDVHEREIFACPHCNKQFVRHSHVLRHIAQKGCGGNGVSLYPCEICDAVFTRKDNLMVHLRLQHIVSKDFSCKHCTFHTRTFSKLIIHSQKYHDAPPHRFECDYCGKITSSRAAISKHLEIHGEKKYSCDVCAYKTFTVEVMRRHVFTHVDDKPYKCTLCNSSYIQRVQLKRHYERHTGNVCTTCGTTFDSKISLTIHQREHMGLKKLYCPFENCQYAEKEFSTEAGLNSHLKSHVEKQYSCGVCGKTFHNEMNMRRHVATHMLDRPRRCMYCVAARAYVRGEQLVKHVRKSHPTVFQDHLAHVRTVMGATSTTGRVKKTELESILNVLDAEAERILQGYAEVGVLYGGMQEVDEAIVVDEPTKNENNPLMSEEELAESLRKLLTQLIDKETLECFGWPEESVDVLLEKVIEQCGARAADRERWTRVQRLRENAKHLFLYVIEDKNIARMLDTHTIDQIVKHIITQVSEEDTD